MFVVDDLGHSDVGYNNPADGRVSGRGIHSPIDNLADTGVKLLNYYVQPICAHPLR